ncbi:hypothetical protein BD410DRAFT_801991 [Rickenella mellea]|uniref:Uncharacterized protein n=1 Tax=Rickenella mellea TaxID=50990 RepID=A0A4Y7QBS0_9AGAM|nr:hypothetical protein BD410DRAFT_801991 [Rickenella mellea]
MLKCLQSSEEYYSAWNELKTMFIPCFGNVSRHVTHAHLSINHHVGCLSSPSTLIQPIGRSQKHPNGCSSPKSSRFAVIYSQGGGFRCRKHQDGSSVDMMALAMVLNEGFQDPSLDNHRSCVWYCQFNAAPTQHLQHLHLPAPARKCACSTDSSLHTNVPVQRAWRATAATTTSISLHRRKNACVRRAWRFAAMTTTTMNTTLSSTTSSTHGHANVPVRRARRAVVTTTTASSSTSMHGYANVPIRRTQPCRFEVCGELCLPPLPPPTTSIIFSAEHKFIRSRLCRHPWLTDPHLWVVTSTCGFRTRKYLRVTRSASTMKPRNPVMLLVLRAQDCDGGSSPG